MKTNFKTTLQLSALILTVVSTAAHATGGATSGGADTPRRCLERARDLSDGSLRDFYANYLNSCSTENNLALTLCVSETLQATQNINDTINQCGEE